MNIGTRRLTNFALVAVAFLLALVATPHARADEPLHTVPHVRVAQFLGDWYQIAHIPMFFENGNCSCARQQLSLAAGGVVKVFNSCNDGGPTGPLKTISGEAYNMDTRSNARFSVDFHLGFRGSYWIIGLDPQYRFAVVSDEYKYSLYILSKTPELAPRLYEQALALAARQLDTSKLVLTQQKGCTYP